MLRLLEPKLVPAEELLDTERREEELEALVAAYLRREIDHPTFLQRKKQVNARLDLRRAGQTLRAP